MLFDIPPRVYLASSRRSAFSPGNGNGLAVHSKGHPEKDALFFLISLLSSLAYSLLTFAMGFLFVLLYLLG